MMQRDVLLLRTINNLQVHIQYPQPLNALEPNQGSPLPISQPRSTPNRMR